MITESPNFPKAAIAVLVCFLAAFAFYARREAVTMASASIATTSVVQPDASAPAPQPAPGATIYMTQQAAAQIPQEFLTPNGIQIVNRRGQLSLNAIRVAVPDKFHNITYLSGTDPQAVAYLQEMSAEQKKLTFSNPPEDTDSSALPQNHFSSSSKQVAVKTSND